MARPDYSRARWYGAYSGNYSAANRPGSNRIDKVVIHVVQGSWSSAINWFNDARAGVSAHYTVRSSDGFIGQSVQEKDIAYHAGNWPVNQNSIGIEHEGYGNAPARWFTPAMYNSSAKLTAQLCRKYNIPIRRGGVNKSGILAHRQATSTACPGQFDINRYIRLVQNHAKNSGGNDGGNNGGSAGQQIIDNNTSGRFKASSNWDLNTWNDQKFRANYRAARPSRKFIDPARFKVKIPRRGRYRIYARWPANKAYNPRAIFRVRTANGIKSRRINQRRNGGKWVSLGVYDMRAGDGWFVELSRRTAGRGTLVADAIKVVKFG